MGGYEKVRRNATIGDEVMDFVIISSEPDATAITEEILAYNGGKYPEKSLFNREFEVRICSSTQDVLDEFKGANGRQFLVIDENYFKELFPDFTIEALLGELRGISFSGVVIVIYQEITLARVRNLRTFDVWDWIKGPDGVQILSSAFSWLRMHPPSSLKSSIEKAAERYVEENFLIFAVRFGRSTIAVKQQGNDFHIIDFAGSELELKMRLFRKYFEIPEGVFFFSFE